MEIETTKIKELQINEMYTQLYCVYTNVGSKPKKKEKDIDITKETENLKNMKEILKRIESNKLLLSVQNDLFEKEAILNASYKFTNKCYIYIEQNDSFTEIYFQSKDENDDLELIALNFNNELLDQQVRLNTGREFKGIREELVRKAFSTVTKKQ